MPSPVLAKTLRRAPVEVSGAQADLRIGHAKGGKVTAFVSEDPTDDDEEALDARERMARLIFAPRILAQVVKCVAQFGVADHLATGPCHPADLAAVIGLDASAAGRLLRYCTTVGLVRREKDGRYHGTELLATLRSDDPYRLRSFAMAQNGPGQWAVLSRLDEALRTGAPQAAEALGCELYEYYGRPDVADEAAAYRQGLLGRSVDVQDAVVDFVDTRGLASVLDVGGSAGSMVMALMLANPDLRGAVLDRPDAAPAAEAQARRLGVSERFEFIAGNFFEEVPGSDLFLLKNVLGNWDDDRCVAILENSRRKALPESRWVIVENAVDESSPKRWAVDVDIVTLVAVGGRVRSVDDYRRLLTRAGLRFVRSASATAGYQLIEAVLR